MLVDGYMFCCPLVGMYPCKKPNCRCEEFWNEEAEAQLAKTKPVRLAKLMRQWRNEQGLSVAQAGAELDLSPRTIEGIEQGKGFAAGRVLELALLSKLTKT